MSLHTLLLEISCQQVMADDASVFSVQWADLPVTITGSLSSRDLLFRYLGYIKKCTLTLIRPMELENGIELRLAKSGLSLISFLPPEYNHDFTILRICGGFLVQPRQCDRGELRFGVEKRPESVRISLQLSDFCPLILGSNSPSFIRFWLYRITQAAIHRLVTVRFLLLLYRELVGSSARVQIKNVSVRDGKAV